MNLAAIERTIDRKFSITERVGKQKDIIRCERRYKGKPLSVYYFDLSERVLQGDFELQKYQESLLADDFYSHQGPLQWNYYMVFLVGTSADLHGRDAQLKKIVFDDSYARKFVVREDDLEPFVRRSTMVESSSATGVQDLVVRWQEKLDAAGLGAVSGEQGIASIIRDIKDGTAPKERLTNAPAGAQQRFELGRVNAITMDNYRRRPECGRFAFAQVNLITGPNGSGKTSLLEAVELCICGKTSSNGVEPDAKIELETGTAGTLVYRENDHKEYRNRDKILYGASYGRGNEMQKSFARYNFFGTDAAFKLASEDSPEAIKEAFTNFILGDQATHVDRRLRRVTEELGIAERKLQVQHDEAKLGAEQIDKELVEINATLKAGVPDDALKNITQGIPLIDRAATVPVPLAEGRRTLGSIKSKLGTIADELDWLKELTPHEVAKHEQQMRLLQPKVKLALETIENTRAKLAQSQKAHSDLAATTSSLQKAVACLNIPGIEHVDKLSQDDARMHSLKSGRPIAQSLVASLQAAASSGQKFPSPTDSERLNELQPQVSALKKRISTIETQLGTRSAMASELRALGLKYIDETGDETACPLCKTTHPVGVLTALFVDTIQDSAAEAELFELREQMTALRFEVADLESRMSLVNGYRTAREQLGEAGLKLRAARSSQKALSSTSDLLESVNAEIEEIEHRSGLRGALKELGLSVESYSILRQTIAAQFEVPVVPSSRPDLLAAHTEAGKQQRDIEKKMSGLQELVQRKQEALRLELADIFSGLSELEYLLDLFPRRCDEVDAAQEHIASLREVLKIEENTNLEALRRRVDLACRDLDDLAARQTRVSESSQLLKDKTKQHRKLNAQVERSGASLSRVQMALEAVGDILETDSKEQNLAEFIQQYKETILRIFLRLQLPDDFSEILLDGDEFLLVREDGEETKLSRISTGQRAALALAIFLALNSSIRKKIGLVVIDDPVANTDDLNSLAFLDYLRNLALEGTQILFATADAELANLFEMKFKFLEETNDFQRITLGLQSPRLH